jgi:hypothetical protein
LIPLFDGLPEVEIVTVFQDKDGFGNLPEFLQGVVKRMLPGVGIEAIEKLRGGRHLQPEAKAKQ